MSYAEFHLSSEGTQRAQQSTRSHPVFELNETIQPCSFNLKQASIPLSWCNVASGSATILVDDPSLPGAFDLSGPTVSVWKLILAPKCYNIDSLAQSLQVILRAFNTGNAEVEGAHGGVSWGNVVVAVESDLRLSFTIPTTFNVGANLEIRIYWEGDLKTFANRTWDNTDYLALPHDELVAVKTLSKHPWRLIPNFIYLHSNIMTGTSYGRQLRTQGGFKSNTILAKIPINSEYIFGEQVMPYTNMLDPAFMYSAGSSLSHLEFWFTDETTGRELDFQNVGFSLTLAMCFNQ